MPEIEEKRNEVWRDETKGARFQFNNLTAKTHVKLRRACTFSFNWIFFLCTEKTKKRWLQQHSVFFWHFSGNFSVEKHVRVQKEDVNHSVFFSANFPGNQSVFLKIFESSDLRLLSNYQLELSAHNLLYHRSALLWFILGHWASNKPPLTVPGWRRRALLVHNSDTRDSHEYL